MVKPACLWSNQPMVKPADGQTSRWSNQPVYGQISRWSNQPMVKPASRWSIQPMVKNQPKVTTSRWSNQPANSRWSNQPVDGQTGAAVKPGSRPTWRQRTSAPRAARLRRGSRPKTAGTQGRCAQARGRPGGRGPRCRGRGSAPPPAHARCADSGRQRKRPHQRFGSRAGAARRAVRIASGRAAWRASQNRKRARHGKLADRKRAQAWRGQDFRAGVSIFVLSLQIASGFGMASFQIAGGRDGQSHDMASIADRKRERQLGLQRFRSRAGAGRPAFRSRAGAGWPAPSAISRPELPTRRQASLLPG